MPTPAVRSVSLEGEDISLDLELVSEEGGKRTYRMKRATHGSRSLPGLPAALLLSAFAFRSTSAPVVHEPDPEAEGRAKKGEVIVEGTASSTSKDWYGTEMDRDALEDMARQFTAGVSLTPRHNGWFDAVEWDEVIGMTMEATVRATDVVNPSDPTEQGYTLAIKAKLFPEEEKAQNLHRRLQAEQPIGLSIGGWFTDVRVVTDDKDEVERIIVLRVILDHLAVTRSPANPDSTGLRLLRSLSEKAVKGFRVRATPTPVVPDPSTPVARSAEETAPTTPASPSEGNPSDNLDEPTPADDTTSSRGGDPSPSTSEDPPMTEAEIARIAAEAVRSVLAEQARTTPAPAPVPAPAPTAPAVDWEARAKAAEAQNGVLQGRVREMAGRSGSGNRRTMVPNHGYSPGKGEGSQLRSLVNLAREEGRAVAVAEVSERHEAVLGADRYDPTVSRAMLERTLQETINAAIQDGIIKDPTTETAWG